MGHPVLINFCDIVPGYDYCYFLVELNEASLPQSVTGDLDVKNSFLLQDFQKYSDYLSLDEQTIRQKRLKAFCM